MPHPNEQAVARIEHLRLRLGFSPAERSYTLPCSPYQVVIRNPCHFRDNIDIEVHYLRNDPTRFEPLLNTRPGIPLDPKIRGFRDNWQQARDNDSLEDTFRLSAALATLFNILLPEDAVR